MIKLTPALSRALADQVQRLDAPGRIALYAALDGAETEADVAALATGVEAAFREDEPRDRGGKWTRDGGGQGLSPDVLAAVDRNLARFAETGQGYPVGDQPLSDARVANYAQELDEMGGQLRKKADRERWAADKGVQFTGFALDRENHMPGTQVFVALDKGRVTRRALIRRVAGAISFYEQDDEAGGRFIHVDYLGTTGTAAGAGTALAHAVARYAAARHLGVMGEPENPGAAAFWSKMGWHDDPLDLGATTFAGWTPDEAAEVAARGQ